MNMKKKRKVYDETLFDLNLEKGYIILKRNIKETVYR